MGDVAEGGSDEDTWKAGQFVAFTMAAPNPFPLVVGIVIGFQDSEDGEDGDEVLLVWYCPKQNHHKGAKRSKYGKGGWSQYFVRQGRKRERSTSLEPSTCPSLLYFLPLFFLRYLRSPCHYNIHFLCYLSFTTPRSFSRRPSVNFLPCAPHRPDLPAQVHYSGYATRTVNGEPLSL